jgi:hypothetical protein
MSEPPNSPPPSEEPARRRNPIRFGVDFWTRPIRAEPLALFRIALAGSFFLCLAISMAPNLGLYLGPDGLCPASALSDDWLKKQGHFSLLRELSANLPFLEQWMPEGWNAAWAQWCDDPTHAGLLFGIWLISLLGVTLGLFTRLSTVVAWALTCSFHYRLDWVLNGGDAFSRNGLFYLMLSPAGAAWSLDSWRRRRRKVRGTDPERPVTIPPWSVRLMQIQLCLVYLFTGAAKIAEEVWHGRWTTGDWLNGEAIYWVLNDTALTRWPYCRVTVPLLVCRLLTWGTLFFEIGFPFFVLFRRLRPWLLLGGLTFHLGILAVTEVGWFSHVTLCWYALFLPAEKVDQFFRWVARSLPSRKRRNG